MKKLGTGGLGGERDVHRPVRGGASLRQYGMGRSYHTGSCGKKGSQGDRQALAVALKREV